ncbi:MAG: type I restriction endonuclease, partial [Vibrionaceae bacterium]
MVSKTNEQALESAIEKSLAGISSEEFKEGLSQPLGAGYVIGSAKDFNMQYAIDERFFWQFLQETQAQELAKLQKHSSLDWQRKILERFNRIIKAQGILHLLKKGLSVDDAHFTLLYPAPLASSGEIVKKNFANNIFSCTRQVHYSLANPQQEIDMVLFINGIPLITLELKNAWTRQTARYHGQKQYRTDRDATQPLLNFGRCLVHMAADTDEVYMTTKLAGSSTFFLPFNKGNNFGPGNPTNPTGHKTAYLWQEVFTKESLTNIIQHFVRLDGSSKDPLSKRTLFFPRYH